jgi:hypothetical protein
MISSVVRAAVAAIALFSADTFAADATKMPKDEVGSTVAGKTLVYTAANGAVLRVYYSADGHLTGTGSGVGARTQSSGAWTVDEEGRLCQKIRQGPMVDRCFFLMRADGAYRLSLNGSTLGTAVTLE